MMSRIMRRAPATAVLLVVAGVTGCGLLDVSDPTAIEDKDVANAAGADLLRRDAVTRMYDAVGATAATTGLLSDEIFSIGQLDRRQRNSGEGEYFKWQGVRYAAAHAVPELLGHGLQAARGAHVGEMMAVRGYAAVWLAEAFCPGFPLHDIVDSKPVYGGPLSTGQAFERAVAEFDSALVSGADSARILNLARIGRARALLGLGRFAEAGAAVHEVPTEYEWLAEFSASSSLYRNPIGAAYGSFPFVANREGRNGLDFIEANDPRLETRHTFDLFGFSFYDATKYPNGDAPIVIASGVEARLIEAEAELRARPSGSQWLAILNTLRTRGQDLDGNWMPGTGGVAGLAQLPDPGSDAARVDLIFRERAFWLYGTGHRLGDLRRLMAHYGRASETIFPVGPYYRPQFGNYGSLTNLSFPAESEAPYSPSVTGCTDQ